MDDVFPCLRLLLLALLFLFLLLFLLLFLCNYIKFTFIIGWVVHLFIFMLYQNRDEILVSID
jgi:hypothetical protein